MAFAYRSTYYLLDDACAEFVQQINLVYPTYGDTVYCKC
jgi:hypothetical protein